MSLQTIKVGLQSNSFIKRFFIKSQRDKHYYKHNQQNASKPLPHYESVKLLLHLRVTQKTLQLPFYLFLFPSTVFGRTDKRYLHIFVQLIRLTAINMIYLVEFHYGEASGYYIFNGTSCSSKYIQVPSTETWVRCC